MRERRVDRVRTILETMDGGRARVHDLLEELRHMEGNSEISYSSVLVAVNAENSRLESMGERPLFLTSRNGEERGWIGIESSSRIEPGSTVDKIVKMVKDSNRKVAKELRARLLEMDWRIFESSFLVYVLENLGFEEVEITQATRDGGADARVKYNRGLVKAKAIVSAKRWSTKTAVGVQEVQRVRGIKGDEDTAIIITTGRFSTVAKSEARPGQNQRIVYLIDGDLLVDICKQHKIGVKAITLPEPIFVLDEKGFLPEDELEEELSDQFPDAGLSDQGHGATQPPEDGELQPALEVEQEEVAPDRKKLKRFWESMLNEISVADIARLAGLSEGTVRTYLSNPERKTGLAQRIRENDKAREEALRLVELARMANT